MHTSAYPVLAFLRIIPTYLSATGLKNMPLLEARMFRSDMDFFTEIQVVRKPIKVSLIEDTNFRRPNLR